MKKAIHLLKHLDNAQHDVIGGESPSLFRKVLNFIKALPQGAHYALGR